MSTKLTIVMYHYVRELKNSRFPEIKGLELTMFQQQLSYIEQHYQVVRMEQVLQAVTEPEKYSLPENALLLTFDDGYIDHFTNVFPILVNRGWQGSFFVAAKTLKEKTVLDVNKIHFILACSDIQVLLPDVFRLLNHYRLEGYEIEPDHILFNKLAHANRWDSKEVIFIKRLLQNELDEMVRNLIVNELFEKYTGMKEEVFAGELYMNMEQIRCMKAAGMYFGLHGYEHYWLGKLTEEKMKADIEMALDYFDGIIDRNNWVMNYPYGSSGKEVIDYIRTKGCSMGITVEARTADIKYDDRYLLPRLDTNDLPPKGKECS